MSLVEQGWKRKEGEGEPNTQRRGADMSKGGKRKRGRGEIRFYNIFCFCLYYYQIRFCNILCFCGFVLTTQRQFYQNLFAQFQNSM